MKSQTIFETYRDLMIGHGHKEIPNVSVVPDNDPTLLFVNSGMFPLVPYLSGESHPMGKRLVNIQRSVRFEDIEEVGDSNRHTTQFHMIGNWSLGDYFKENQLRWIYTFYVEKLGLDITRLYATVFRGNSYAEKDTMSISLLKDIYKSYGVEANEGERIFALSEDDNWWKRGDAPGELGGPSSEVYYYLGCQGENGTGLGLNLEDPEHADDFIEIGNSVFMEFKRNESMGWDPITQKNVDYGGGLERIALVTQGKKDIFETDNFFPIIERIEKITGEKYGSSHEITKAMRVLADHMRASVILVMDDISPSNKDQGYILRRIIRRMARYARIFNIKTALSRQLVDPTLSILSWLYPDLKNQKERIVSVIEDEENKFHAILSKMEPQVKKQIQKLSHDEKSLAEAGFNLYQSSGYPFEILLEDLVQAGIQIDHKKITQYYNNLFQKHKLLSRTGSEKKFKGGLADQSEQVVRYHTATHLIHEALSRVTQNTDIRQEGSNITGERLRFDFFSPEKLTDNQKKEVEILVNKQISAGLPVTHTVMPREKADSIGAKSFFHESYGEKVKVYFIGGDLNKPQDSFSKEFCGGPHVENTADIGKIEIYKMEKIGSNKYRLYARNTTQK